MENQGQRNNLSGCYGMTVILTCSGISNTGKLTTQVAIVLMRHFGGEAEWIRARDNPAGIDEAVSGDSHLIVIKGCTDHCACKKLKESGRVPPIHIVATELGHSEKRYGRSQIL
jgi:uncharacterized metal-binding protein